MSGSTDFVTARPLDEHYSEERLRRISKWTDGKGKSSEAAKLAKVLLGNREREYSRILEDSLVASEDRLEAQATELRMLRREVRIATLVEAAKLVCEYCERGIDLSGFNRPPYRIKHHGDELVDGPCYAEPIILKLVEEWA